MTEKERKGPTTAVCLSLLTIVAVLSQRPGAAQPIADEWYGPNEYRCFNGVEFPGDCEAQDSPFAELEFMYFHLNDFEGGVRESPGAKVTVASCRGIPKTEYPESACPFLSVDHFLYQGLIDSVYEDDRSGSDNDSESGRRGNSLWVDAKPGIVFEFDISVLGGFPTHAGIVVTDGLGEIVFSAYDSKDALIWRQSAIFAAESFEGETSDDVFFGVVYDQGISRIAVVGTAEQSGIEVDHLQYGRGCKCVAARRSSGIGVSVPAEDLH